MVNFWAAVAVFLSITIAIIFTPILFRHNDLKVPSFFIQTVKAVKHTNPSPSSFHAASSNERNTISSSVSPSQSNTGLPSAGSCINYTPSTRTITVSCNSAKLTNIDNKLHDTSILAKQTPAAGVWFLNANLVIAKGATFHIDSTDTKWLKISSKVTRGAGVAKIAHAYWIDVHGVLKIDSVKITSWDPTTNYYAITNGSRTGSGVFILGTPRPSIVVENNATGTTDITNSEIAYLGYEQGKHRGGSGLSYYYGGDGSIIRNNSIHHIYFGLYTFGVGHMTIENNIIRNSGHYGLDPHTGTPDMIIRNNIVYDNNGSGIICSLNCYNIVIENNNVHDNAENGIDFSRNMYNSLARNNLVYNEAQGIFVSQSHNNQVYNNTISDSADGIYVNSGSTNNKIYDNTIMNSKSHAILIKNASSENTFYTNKIVSTKKEGLNISQDTTSKNNTFSNNQIVSDGVASSAPAEPSTETNTIKHPHKKTSIK
jgi:poly(beta-D-mannuronate) C5 epimerase